MKRWYERTLAGAFTRRGVAAVPGGGPGPPSQREWSERMVLHDPESGTIRAPSPAHEGAPQPSLEGTMLPAAKTNGHAPQLELDRGFIVGSGIECSAPVIAGGHRQDELRKTGHWTNVGEDLGLVADFGIRYLRYGIPC